MVTIMFCALACSSSLWLSMCVHHCKFNLYSKLFLDSKDSYTIIHRNADKTKRAFAFLFFVIVKDLMLNVNTTLEAC